MRALWTIWRTQKPSNYYTYRTKKIKQIINTR